MLTAGTLGDRFGRKRLFLSGLVLFLLGSWLCGFAPTLGWFLCGRVIQGVGGAALSPGSLSVLAAAFPEPRSRAQAIGIWSGVSGIALGIGPLVGGWLISIANWPAIFFVICPLAWWRSLWAGRAFPSHGTRTLTDRPARSVTGDCWADLSDRSPY